MSITAAIAEAKKQADNAVPAIVPQTLPTGRRQTASDFLTTARTQVDAYLKVSFHGLTIGKNTELVESLKAVIDLSKLKYCTQVRFGTPPQYFKTFDNIRAADGTGRPWTDILAMAKSIDPTKSSDPFPTAEIFMTVLEDVVSTKGTVVATVGQTLSYTPSYTGGDPLAAFLTEVTDNDGNIDKSIVNATVGFEPKTKGSKNWGIVTYKFDGLQ